LSKPTVAFSGTYSSREFDARVSPGNTSVTFITFADGAAESRIAIRQAVDALAARATLA
jgi:hypothetical protein